MCVCFCVCVLKIEYSYTKLSCENFDAQIKWIVTHTHTHTNTLRLKTIYRKSALAVFFVSRVMILLFVWFVCKHKNTHTRTHIAQCPYVSHANEQRALVCERDVRIVYFLCVHIRFCIRCFFDTPASAAKNHCALCKLVSLQFCKRKKPPKKETTPCHRYDESRTWNRPKRIRLLRLVRRRKARFRRRMRYI